MNSYKQYIDSNEWEFVPYEETPTMKSGGKLNKLGVKNSLWNNIRANKGSGKAPTKEMLTQEKKINAKYQQGGPTEYDTIPSYLNYIKAKQIHNEQGANDALKHIGDVRGNQTMNDMRFLGDGLKNSNINSLAKTRLPNEQNPQMKLLYSQIEQNPQLVDNFQYFMPENKSMAKFQKGGQNPPIIVNNPNDKKLRTYTDSLSLYNKGEIDKKQYEKFAKTLNLETWESNKAYSPNQKIQPIKTKGFVWPSSQDNNNDGRTDYMKTNDGKLINTPSNIGSALSKNDMGNLGFLHLYQKPVQPVVYQKQQQSSPKEFIKYFDDEGQYNKAVKNRGDSLSLNKELDKSANYYKSKIAPLIGKDNDLASNLWTKNVVRKSSKIVENAYDNLTKLNKKEPKLRMHEDSNDRSFGYNTFARPVMIPKLREQYQRPTIPENTVGRDVDLNYSAPPNLQMTPSQGMPLKTYTMHGRTPVYGPGGAGQPSSLIGMLDSGNNFYPDYNNTAKRTGVNQADSDMLNNPEAMTKYLQGKGAYNPNIQKFQFGGSNYRNQMMNYLFNEDDEEETLPNAVSQNTAPTVEDVQEQQEQPIDNSQNELAMAAAMQGMEENPYTSMKNKYTKDRLSPDLQNILGITTQMFPGLKVTSTTRGIHLKRSAHYDGQAADFGANSSNAVDYQAFKAALPSLSKQLGFKYIDEKNHIHLSKSTKGKL